MALCAQIMHSNHLYPYILDQLVLVFVCKERSRSLKQTSLLGHTEQVTGSGRAQPLTR